MSSIVKVLLVLTVMFCISSAQPMHTGSQCLCQKFRNRLNQKNEINDIQIYSETIFCDKVEIVITLNNGNRYCLNPRRISIKSLLNKVMGKRQMLSSRPTMISSDPGINNFS